MAAAQIGLQAGVIRQGLDALGTEESGGFLHLAPALAIDDPGVAHMLVTQEAQQL